MRERPAHVLRPAVVARVLRGPRAGAAEPRSGVRRSLLRVGDALTPLCEAGPADAREAVVFVHGNPGSSADWEPLLAAIGAHRRAVAWDAPGFGRAAGPAGLRQTVEAHAAFIGRALDTLGIARAHLVLARLRRPVGPALGGRGARALRVGGPAHHGRAAGLSLARARPPVADPRRR